MISKRAKIGKNVIIKEGVIIEDNVVIGDNCYIDYNAIIKSNVVLGDHSFVGAGCILGEFLNDFFSSFSNVNHPLRIGKHAVIRSQSILYGNSEIGDYFSTGHKVIIREKTQIENHVSIGTLTDIQGDCHIGNYTRLHSNVHVGMKTKLDDFVWVFPYVVFTNDPTPPSENLSGVTVEKYAVISTGSVILPGVTIHSNALVGADTNVTKDVPEKAVVIGNPGKIVKNIKDIQDSNGNHIYPWYYTFRRGMPWAELGYQKWSEDFHKSANIK